MGIEREASGPLRDEPTPLFRRPEAGEPYPVQAFGELLGDAVHAIPDIVQCDPALSAGGIRAFPVLPEVEHLTIYADKDAKLDGTNPGVDAARTCVQRWAEAGRWWAIEHPRKAGWISRIGLRLRWARAADDGTRRGQAWHQKAFSAAPTVSSKACGGTLHSVLMWNNVSTLQSNRLG